MSKKKIMNYEKEKRKSDILISICIAFIISLVFGRIYFSSNNVYKYQSTFQQASIIRCQGYNVDGSVYNYDESYSEHYIEFSVPQVNARTFYVQLNKAPGDTVELKADIIRNGEKIGKIDSCIPGYEQYAKLYLENKKIDTIRVNVKGTIDFNSANIESYQLNGDNTDLKELKQQSKIVSLFMFIILSFAIIWCKSKKVADINLANYKKQFLNFIIKNKKKFIIATLGFIIIYVIVICWFALIENSFMRNKAKFIIAICIWMIICSIYVFIKNNKFKFEQLFLVIGIALACLFVTVLPNRLNISWDDQIHYQNVVTLSHYPDKYMSVAEYDYYLSCFVPQLRNACDKNDDSYNNILNDGVAKRTLFVNDQEVTLKSLVYLPMAIAMMILRGIGLKLSYVIIGTKLSGMLFYLYIIYRGMRHLSDGKMVISIFSLLPGTMFIISNFNYDYWLLALITYSVCYIIGEYQKADKCIVIKDLFLIFGSFLFGIIVKVVYIPLLGFAAFFNKSKFKENKWYYLYRGFFITVVVSAVIGFIILLFGGGLGTGDTRGGEGISTVGQINYIISNPKEYSITLLKFLKDYWSFGRVKDYNVATAYMDRTNWYWWLVAVFSIAVMFFDRSKSNSVKWYIGVLAIPLGFITSCMVATALYVVYTPVASLQIAGCQSRYLLPIISAIALTFSRIYIPKINISEKIRKVGESLTMTGAIVFCLIMLAYLA